MKKFWERLFSSTKSVNEVLKTTSKVVDVIIGEETPVEQASEMRADIIREYNKWIESTTGSRIVRRFIALMLITMGCMYLIGAFIAIWINAELVKNFIEVLGLITPWIMLILSFYFSIPVIDKFRGK